MSMNRWNYVEGNPINYFDPSGHIKKNAEAREAELIAKKLHDIYNVNIEKDWGYRLIPSGALYYSGCQWQEGNWRNAHELELTLKAVKQMAEKLGSAEKFKSAMGNHIIKIYRLSSELILGSGAYSLNNVILPNNVFNYTEGWAKGQIVHELAHVWDVRQGLQLSDGMMYETKSYRLVCSSVNDTQLCMNVYYADNAIEEAPTDYAKGTVFDDWADSFKVFMYPSMGTLRSIRRGYIESAIQNIQ